jgi:hypothetical protein
MATKRPFQDFFSLRFCYSSEFSCYNFSMLSRVVVIIGGVWFGLVWFGE